MASANDIAGITDQFQLLLAGLDVAALNRKPEPSSWSIGENLSHLIQLNSSYFPIFDQVISGTYSPPPAARLSPLARWMGRLLRKAMQSPRKFRASPVWNPAASDFDRTILSQFTNHQEELARYNDLLKPHYADGTIIHSPASRLIVYPLNHVMEILLAHELRHLDQCRRILDQIPTR